MFLFISNTNVRSTVTDSDTFVSSKDGAEK